jgi:hypothetical protein
MIWIHKSILNKLDHYKFWNDRVIDTRLETERGHLTILAVYTPTEGRDELYEQVYETLQNILHKVNKKDYIMLIRDMNARVGNNRVTNTVGTKGEATLNSNGGTLIDFCTFAKLKVTNTFLSTKKLINFLVKQEGTNQLLITL